MIPDPLARGRDLAAFFARLEPGLWRDLEGSGALRVRDETIARREWQVFALYACVRGLIAAGGFGDDNRDAVDAMHESVVERWAAEPDPGDPVGDARGLIAARYAEYGLIGEASEARGADVLVQALGEAAARHMSGTDIADAELGRMVGDLHDAIAHGAAAHVRGDDA